MPKKRGETCVLTRELSRVQAQNLCDQLQSYGIGYELACDGPLFLVHVAQGDLALARALTGLPGLESERPSKRLLRRAGILPLLCGGALAIAGWTGEGSLEGYRGRVFHADDDHDGRVDRHVVFGHDGSPAAVMQDRDGDGVMDRYLQISEHEVVELLDRDGDGIPD